MAQDIDWRITAWLLCFLITFTAIGAILYVSVYKGDPEYDHWIYQTNKTLANETVVTEEFEM